MISAVQAYQQKEEKKNKIIGYVVTTVVHVLLLLLLLWFMLTPPDPPLEYGGLELTMSLGEINRGGPSPVPVQEQQPVTPPPVEQTEEKIATQDMEEAPAIKTSESPKSQKQPVKITEPVEQPRKVDERALFKKKTATDANSGFGDGDIPGNEGRPDGQPHGNPDGNGIGDGTGGSGTGTGPGEGWGSYDLAGRLLVKRPQITDNSRETGKVVVRIVVDRNGRVLKAEPGQKGTNTSSSILWEKAKQGALEARFSPRSDGPDEQYGTMTFIFKFKP